MTDDNSPLKVDTTAIQGPSAKDDMAKVKYFCAALSSSRAMKGVFVERLSIEWGARAGQGCAITLGVGR